MGNSAFPLGTQSNTIMLEKAWSPREGSHIRSHCAGIGQNYAFQMFLSRELGNLLPMNDGTSLVCSCAHVSACLELAVSM